MAEEQVYSFHTVSLGELEAFLNSRESEYEPVCFAWRPAAEQRHTSPLHPEGDIITYEPVREVILRRKPPTN